MFRSNKFIFTFILTLAFAAAVSAQNTTSYVAVNTGSDANPCSAVSQCQSITKALTVTNTDGKITLTESGTYDPVTVNMPVTIAAADGVNATIAAIVPFSTAVQIPSLASTDNVTFRNIHFFGATGNQVGIYMMKGGNLNVDNCTFTRLNYGIQVDSGLNIFVRNSIFRENWKGMYVAGPNETVTRVSVDTSVFETNSLAGINLQNKVYGTIKNSLISNNGFRGILVSSDFVNLQGELVVDNCEISHNLVGIYAGALGSRGETVRLSRSTITYNKQAGVAMTPVTVIVSYGNNVFAGNFPDVSGGVLTSLGLR